MCFDLASVLGIPHGDVGPYSADKNSEECRPVPKLLVGGPKGNRAKGATGKSLRGGSPGMTIAGTKYPLPPQATRVRRPEKQ